ncbi:MAG: type VI secretion system tip protein TssI/VgrG [Polyangiaceae bacterium]
MTQATPRALYTRKGNEADYMVWIDGVVDGALEVVDFHGVEEISRPYRFTLTLVQPIHASALDLDALIGAPAALLVATHDHGDGFIVRHGVVLEAEATEQTSTLRLYRIVLAPPFELARFRTHCRTFVDTTLEAIIGEVLRGAVPTSSAGGGAGLSAGAGLSGTVGRSVPGALQLIATPGDADEWVGRDVLWSPPEWGFAWHIVRGEALARLRDKRIRNYVVQYNESDFAFVSRLLEEEGLSYTFEHAQNRLVMWLTDQPGLRSIFPPRPRYMLSSGAHAADDRRAAIRSFRAIRRERARAVTMRDYDWHRAGLVIEGRSPAGGTGGAARAWSTHYEYPARDEDPREDPCSAPARVRAERFDAERQLCEGTASVRGLPVGRRIHIEADGDAARGEHLVVRVESYGVQHAFRGTALDEVPFGFDGRSEREAGAFRVRFASLPSAVPFRPALETPRPRVDGVQSATVTDEAGGSTGETEIHTDDWARVRVRFPWDLREDGRPSSKWIRVSQAWAGAGFGGLMIPRVGQEVLVAYANGDPDHPVIVGRVYNVKNPIPTLSAQEPEVSTLKTQSSPSATGDNEIRFQDLAGKEEIYLHAQRQLREAVGEDHISRVGRDRLIQIGGASDTTIGTTRSTTIGGDVVTRIGGSAARTVRGDETRTVEGDEHGTTLGDLRTQVEGDETHHVTGDRSVAVSGGQSHHTHGAFHAVADRGHAFHSRGTFHSSATEDHRFATHGTFSSSARTSHVFASPDVRIESKKTDIAPTEAFVVRVGACFIKIAKGMITLNDGAGASVSLVGGKLLVNTDSDLEMAAGGEFNVKASAINLKDGGAERDDKKFDDEVMKAPFTFRVYADENTDTEWEHAYKLEAIDGSFSQEKTATSDEDRHDKGYSDVVFEDVPVGKKYDISVERDGEKTVLLQNYEFEG